MPTKRPPGAATVRAARGPTKGGVVFLSELRRDRRISQAALADAMDSTQPEVSRLERRDDHRISTLLRVVDAMGGRLEIVVRFPKGVAYMLRLGGQK